MPPSRSSGLVRLLSTSTDASTNDNQSGGCPYLVFLHSLSKEFTVILLYSLDGAIFR